MGCASSYVCVCRERESSHTQRQGEAHWTKVKRNEFFHSASKCSHVLYIRELQMMRRRAVVLGATRTLGVGLSSV